MTFPIYMFAHFIYGMAMAFGWQKRVLREGDIIGLPLLLSLLPVCLVTVPCGVLLLRYAAGWFSHGLIMGEATIAYERFHFGMIMLVLFAACGSAIAGFSASIFYVSRDVGWQAQRLARSTVAIIAIVLLCESRPILHVTGNYYLWQHPVGIVSLVITAALFLSFWFIRERQ